MASIFGKPKAPPLQPVTRMPDAQDPTVLEERKRKEAEALKRGGRDSTVLSENLGSIVGATGSLGA